MKTQVQIRKIEGPSEQIECFTFWNGALWSASRSAVYKWGRSIATFTCMDLIYNIFVWKDCLYSSHQDGTVRSWNTEGQHKVVTHGAFFQQSTVWRGQLVAVSEWDTI